MILQMVVPFWKLVKEFRSTHFVVAMQLKKNLVQFENNLVQN